MRVSAAAPDKGAEFPTPSPTLDSIHRRGAYLRASVHQAITFHLCPRGQFRQEGNDLLHKTDMNGPVGSIALLLRCFRLQ